MLKLGLYQHWQGAFHQVRAVIAQEDTGEQIVLHQDMASRYPQLTPLDTFTTPVDSGNGELVERYTFIGQEDLDSALKDIFSGILSEARARRATTEGYATLFKKVNDLGVGAALETAEMQMREIVATLVDVLEARSGSRLPHQAHDLLLGLPLLSAVVRRDIEKEEGPGCCADKTRLVLRTYFRKMFGVPHLPSVD